jgi:predicted nucleic acid-binding protein
MQKVVSNASPLIHLAKIGQLNLLHEFFGEIAIPRAVYEECITEGEEREEITTIKNADWLHSHNVADKNLVTVLQSELDHGESEAIALALETSADLILLDDAEAREKARLYHLKITGTLGILLRAKKEAKLQSFSDIIKQLLETGFWIDGALKRRLLVEVGEV